MQHVVDFLTTEYVEVSGVEVERLGVIDWFRLDYVLSSLIGAKLQLADVIIIICQLVEVATGLHADELEAEWSLVAFPYLIDLNQLKYINKDIFEGETDEEMEEKIGGMFLVELVTTLAERYGIGDIREMSPEFAMLTWQRIREEKAIDRNAVFYSTEFGYDRTITNKKKGDCKMKPRESPYTMPWHVAQMKRSRKKLAEMTPPPSPLIKHGDKIVDVRKG